MARSRKKRNSQNAQLRLFAWLLALLIALLSWRLSHTPWGLVLQLAAALVFALGTMWPSAFQGLYATLTFTWGRKRRALW